MIADLLDVSRITSGKIRLELRTVAPADVVDAAVAAVLPTAYDKDIRVNKSLDRATDSISADGARLQQVVWNLLVNAIKFTPEGGSVDLSLKQVGTAIEICVHDNGVGLSPTLLPQIFDRFRQGDASTTRQHAGLGLGLAIVKQLVEMHGGTVLAESPGEGLGATFTVRLPTAGTKIAPNVKTQGSSGVDMRTTLEEKLVDLSGVRVLIVEDDADSRRVLTRIVTDCAGVVRAVGNVPEALENIDEFQPEILVSDLGMPRQDGFELIRLVRERGYTSKRLPAIALSAFADSKSRQEALLAGFQGNLSKPVESREITAAIAALVSRKG
jgi:CheY-like chemotaxis protein/two-component sensor histidine kinase